MGLDHYYDKYYYLYVDNRLTCVFMYMDANILLVPEQHSVVTLKMQVTNNDECRCVPDIA